MVYVALIRTCVFMDTLWICRYLGAAVQNMSVGIDFSLVAALLDMVTPQGEQDVAVSLIWVEPRTACRPGQMDWSKS